MEAEYSSEFLACLNEYRRKSTIDKVFRAWRKQTHGNKRYLKECTALEYWNYITLRKCFTYFKKLRLVSEAGGIPYTKGIYLIILAASCFLAPKAIKSYGCRLDKLLSLFKQNNIMMPKVEVLKGLVRSWEEHLVQKYFRLLKSRYTNIKAFKMWRLENMRKRCFNYLKETVKNKKVLKIMKRLLVKNYLRQWKYGIRVQKVDNIQDTMAEKFRKRLYLKRCFDVLAEFTRWNKQNTDKMALAKNYYNLNLKMKTLIKLKLSSRAERMDKNHKVMYEIFRRKKLLQKTLRNWKAFQKKKNHLNEKFDKYTNQKNFLKKRNFMNNWKLSYLNKTKVEYYTRLKLLDKGLRGLQQNVEKKYKIETISRFSESHRVDRQSVKPNEPPHYNDLMEVDNKTVDKIYVFRTERNNNFISKCFGKWKVLSQNKAVLRRLKYQAQLYQDLSYYKQFFYVWRNKFNKRVTEAKTYQIAATFNEGEILRKAFDGLSYYYRQRMVKRVKEYKVNERYEVLLMKKVFNVLYTEKQVDALLCQKYYERSCQNTMRRCFDAMLQYTGQNIWRRKTINGFKKEKEEILKTKGFYALKKLTDAHVIKRRSNKLAEIIHAKKLLTKSFLGFKKNQKVNRKFNVITQRRGRKTMKTLYLLWKARFKEERVISKLSLEQGANRLVRVFAGWKKWTAKEKASKAIIRDFTERRNALNLKFIWAIWQKYISISQNKVVLGQALFISYVHNFKKNVFSNWRAVTSRLHRERIISEGLSQRKNNELMARYFITWFDKNTPYREIAIQSRMYAMEKFGEKIRTVFRAWVAVSKERAIRRKLLELWKEKTLQTLLGQAFEGWKVHVAEKSTKKNLVFVKNQFSQLKTLQKVFNVLHEWKVKKQVERENYEQIKYTRDIRVKRDFFVAWSDEFKDGMFQRVGDELVDKYRKIMCFRLFHKKVEERREARMYSEKLDQFADEVYKRRGFLTFMKNAKRLRANRQDIEEREAEFALSRKVKAFSEFKSVVFPRINAMKSNLKAMKFYILRLYSISFSAWKMLYKQGTLSTQREGRSNATTKENRQGGFMKQKLANLNMRQALTERSESNTVIEEESGSERDMKQSSESMRIYYHQWQGRSEPGSGTGWGAGGNKANAIINALSKIQRRYLEEGFESLTDLSFEDAKPATVF